MTKTIMTLLGGCVLAALALAAPVRAETTQDRMESAQDRADCRERIAGPQHHRINGLPRRQCQSAEAVSYEIELQAEDEPAGPRRKEGRMVNTAR